MRLLGSVGISRSVVRAMRLYRPVSTRNLGLSIAAVLAVSCTPTAQQTNPAASGSAKATSAAEGLNDSMQPPPPLGTAVAAASTGGPQRPGAQSGDSNYRTIPAEARQPKGTLRKGEGRPERDETLSVSEFLDGHVEAGHMVSVRGNCRDQFHASGSAGAPPRSRSDWQLADERAALYVSGPMPTACALGPVVVRALVSVDTIQLSGRPLPRRFLVIQTVPH